MDGKVSKSEKMEPLDARKRDRGDNLKKKDDMRMKTDSDVKAANVLLSNQGDVPTVKVTKEAKTNHPSKVTNDKIKKQNDTKTKLTKDIAFKFNTEAEKISHSKTSEMNNALVNKLKVGERVSDKVAKAKINQNQSKDASKNGVKYDMKTDRLKKQANLKSSSKELITDTNKPDATKTESDITKKEKDVTAHRKPLIKTVKSKNDNRVYKAVTFTEQKIIQPTVLEISIPIMQTKKTKTKLVDKNLEAKPASLQGTGNKSNSKTNVKAKSQHTRRNRFTERTKRKRLNRCISSPDKFKKAESPPTEVAKWAPSCLNTHTKPYYEAWVNTTLAAISKISKKDKLFFEKQNIIKTFQESLELGTESPELVHQNYTDECYTGKIRIKQKKCLKGHDNR